MSIKLLKRCLTLLLYWSSSFGDRGCCCWVGMDGTNCESFDRSQPTLLCSTTLTYWGTLTRYVYFSIILCFKYPKYSSLKVRNFLNTLQLRITLSSAIAIKNLCNPSFLFLTSWCSSSKNLYEKLFNGIGGIKSPRFWSRSSLYRISKS